MTDAVKRKILLVEDEHVIALSLATFLSDNGLDVLSLATGEECIDYLAHDSEIELVLMDIQLGRGIDGIETAEKISRLRDIPVVFLTAFCDEETIRRINGNTGYGYVVKTSGNHVILSAINMAFRLYDSKMILKESEENYRMLAENSTDLISKLNSQGEFVYLSPLCREMTGYETGELMGRNIFSFVHRDDRSMMMGHYNRIMALPDIFTINYRFRLKDGEYRWVESRCKRLLSGNGTVEGMIASSRDITERKEAEKALRESEEKLHQIMDGVPAMLSYVDSSGRYVYVNSGYEKWHVTGKENIIGRFVKDILPHDEYERVSLNMKKALEGEAVVFEDVKLNGSGTKKHMRYHFVPHISAGTVLGFFALIFDVTENKKCEQTILSLLNEKDLLLKEVHHRVKNNMGSIAALLYLQLGSMENPEAITEIQDARARVLSMMGIYDILYRSGEYRRVAAGEYFSDLIDKISATYITSPRVRIEKSVDNMTLNSAILFPVGMIVNELLTNALKYAFRDGKPGIITVRIMKKDDKHAEIDIRDNGKGLPDAFEISNTRGFGLTLVKMMIQQINGTIRINRVGGTEFRIVFPV
jgi:PAS domain S-box-containing protein